MVIGIKLSANNYSLLIREKQGQHYTGTRGWVLDLFNDFDKGLKKMLWFMGNAGTGILYIALSP